MTVNEFHEYQKKAHGTSLCTRIGDTEPGCFLVYPALKLAGEAGEVAEKIGKIYRDNNGELNRDSIHALVLEMGDVLWYLAELATYLGVDLSQVAACNLQKLADRAARNKIQGSGDDR